MGRTLRDQVVLISGCSSGIGRALVGELIRQGQRVIATARRPDSIEDLARLSQDRPTPADDFARHVVGKLLAEDAAPIIRYGRGSELLPALARLPVGARDRILCRKFGLPKR